LTYFSHVEYHYCVTVYQSDVKSDLQSVCKENLKFTVFTFFSLTHTSIDIHSSCRIPLLCECLSIWCAIWATKRLQIWHLQILVFLPKSHWSNHDYSHIHRHVIVMQHTTIVWLSINLTCNLRYKSFTTLTLTGFNFVPEFFCVHQIQIMKTWKYGCS